MIEILIDNPKKEGSASWNRYEEYKSAKSIGEFYKLGGKKGDLKNDMNKGYIKIVESSQHEPSPPSAHDDEFYKKLNAYKRRLEIETKN